MNDNKNLLKSYDDKFLDVGFVEFLDESDISPSKKLFEVESLIDKKPIPKKLNVVCLVGGLPFDKEFINEIKSIQLNIANILKNIPHYLVEPENLATECIVLKWPDNNFSEYIIEKTITCLNSLELNKFKLSSFGFQFHKDGAIILRCIDSNSTMRNHRKYMIKNIKEMPITQSSWAHVPLGRILGPVELNVLKKLREYALFTQKNSRFTTFVKRYSLINEHRWYQTERSLIQNFKLF